MNCRAKVCGLSADKPVIALVEGRHEDAAASSVLNFKEGLMSLDSFTRPTTVSSDRIVFKNYTDGSFCSL